MLTSISHLNGGPLVDPNVKIKDGGRSFGRHNFHDKIQLRSGISCLIVLAISSNSYGSNLGSYEAFHPDASTCWRRQDNSSRCQ